MDHATLVKDASARSGLPEAEVAKVVSALADLVHDAHASPDELLHALLGAAEPFRSHPVDPRDPALVHELLDRARAHPLGIDYLKAGHLGSVAATFETHAFTVLAARDQLRRA